MDAFKNILIRQNNFVIFLLGAFISWLWYEFFNKWSDLPTFFVAAIALWLSYLTYQHSLQKFRFELLEKRWPIYEAVLEFCLFVTWEGGLPKDNKDAKKIKKLNAALSAASDSFIGKGYHKSRSLFGDDIVKICKELRDIYSFLVSFENCGLSDRAKNSKQFAESIARVGIIANELPELFSDYVYFGDFKISNKDCLSKVYQKLQKCCKILSK